MRELLDGIGVGELPAGVSRAVLVGNDLSILGMPKPEGFTVNTLWGELAYQLGGVRGYELRSGTTSSRYHPRRQR